MQVTPDPTYTAWPKTDSSVAVINDQSSMSYATLPDLIEDLDSSNPGTLTRTIPGKLIFDQVKDRQFSVIRMSHIKNQFDIYCNWKNSWQTEETETMRKASLLNKDPAIYDPNSYMGVDIGENQWFIPSEVQEYPWSIDDIPIDIDMTKYTYEFGYGKLSAGHLDI